MTSRTDGPPQDPPGNPPGNPPSNPPSNPSVNPSGVRSPTRQGRRPKVSPWGFVGMGAMACVLFLDLGTAGVAPWWVTALFLVLWAVLFAIALRWFVPHPRRVPWLPALGFAVWLPTIVLGTRQLGWG